MVAGPLAFVLIAAFAGITSVRGIQKVGVYANGRTVVIRGRSNEQTGIYELYFHEFESSSLETDKNGQESGKNEITHVTPIESGNEK